MKVIFGDQGDYRLAATVLAQPLLSRVSGLGPEELSVDTSEPIIGELVRRLAQHVPSVLPVFGDQEDVWLVVGREQRDLSEAFQHLTKFVLPTYGLLPSDQRVAMYALFEEGVSPIQDAARACLCGGYTWRSPAALRDIVMQKLWQWTQLENARPALRIERPPTYSEVLGRFQSSLAALDWTGAAECLAQFRQFHLIAAENLAFLRMQFLAEQGKWREIWEDTDFPLLANIYVPRRVRSAMITAFHAAVLSESEAAGNLELSLDRFKQARGRLGGLLNGRFGLAESPVVRVFGYQAVVARDRTALETLLQLEPSDDTTRSCLQAMLGSLPRQAKQVLSPVESLRLALRSGSYDAAAQAAADQETSVDRALAWMRIAVRHPDAVATALSEYESLSPSEQAELEASDPAADFYLERILGYFRRDVPEIRSWHAWFERFIADPDDSSLEAALDDLMEEADNRTWSPEVARVLTRDVQILIGEHEALLRRSLSVRALETLVNQLLLDSSFPRSDGNYPALYEALYTYTLYAASPTAANLAKTLRLVDVVLQVEPSQVRAIAQDLQEWLSTPRLTLEGHVLGALEMLVEQGLPRWDLTNWFRNWLAYLVELPPSASWLRASQLCWLAFGEWLQAGDDILLPLRQQSAAVEAQPEEDPLLRFPAGFQIGLFTLQRGSAERAREIMLERNPSLDVRLCCETDLSPQVSALAQHSDLVVIVATCITHAITYGITPILGGRDPVYPASRGSSSIIRAVEEYASRLAS